MSAIVALSFGAAILTIVAIAMGSIAYFEKLNKDYIREANKKEKLEWEYTGYVKIANILFNICDMTECVLFDDSVFIKFKDGSEIPLKKTQLEYRDANKDETDACLEKLGDNPIPACIENLSLELSYFKYMFEHQNEMLNQMCQLEYRARVRDYISLFRRENNSINYQPFEIKYIKVKP